MKLRSFLLSSATMLAIGSMFLAGCTTDNTVTPPTNTDTRSYMVSAAGVDTLTVTGLSIDSMYVFSVNGSSALTKVKGASARSASSIKIWWTRDAGDVGADTVFYTSTPSAVTTDPYSGAAAITWAPAYKTGPFNIYETADQSPNDPSGLVIDGNNTRTSSLSGTDKANIDLVLESDVASASGLSIYSPDLNGVNTRTTYMSYDSYLVGGGATNNYFTGPVNNSIQTSGSNLVSVYDVPPGYFADSSFIFLVLTASGNYARVEVVPTNGQFWQTSGNNKYVTVNVYVQPTASLGYVGRPYATHNRFTNGQRLTSHTINRQ